MPSGLFRTRHLMLAAAMALFAVPVSAQFYSEGFEFLKAVKDRDGDKVTKALNEPGSVVVNTRDLTSGETALHIVVKRRDPVWVRFLLQRGANPNIRDVHGATPLQVASTLGFVEGMEALIKGGAKVDESDEAGETPLIVAVHRRDIPMVRLLLANRADPDRTDNSGRSARDYAQLMPGGAALVDEFKRADEARKNAPQQGTYGPGA